MTKPEAFSSVWDAIADTPDQPANLQARAQLMRQIAAIIKDSDWRQASVLPARYMCITPLCRPSERRKGITLTILP